MSGPSSEDPRLTAPAPPSRRPIAMVVHAYYDEDPRVRREAETLVAAGESVDVFALRRDGDERSGWLGGVRVHRLDVQRHQGAGIPVYLREYSSFLFRACWALIRAHRRRRYGLVQVHSLPDFLAFAALPLRVGGIPLLLDLHEAMPEFFRSRFPGASNPIAHRLLLIQERLSIAIATAVVTVNARMVERLIGLGIPAAKLHVVPNSASLARFDPAAWPYRPFAADGVVRLVYAGAVTPIYELDVALEAVAQLARDRRSISLEIYGRGDAEPALRTQADVLRIADRVRFHGRIPIEEVPAAIAAADIGLAPTRRDPFTDVSLSTKLFEYGAMGKAVVATGLPMVAATFPPGTISTYAPGEAAAMAVAIARLIDDDQARVEAIARTQEIVRGRSWEHESIAYRDLVESLILR